MEASLDGLRKQASGLTWPVSPFLLPLPPHHRVAGGGGGELTGPPPSSSPCFSFDTAAGTALGSFPTGIEIDKSPRVGEGVEGSQGHEVRWGRGVLGGQVGHPALGPGHAQCNYQTGTKRAATTPMGLPSLTSRAQGVAPPLPWGRHGGCRLRARPSREGRWGRPVGHIPHPTPLSVLEHSWAWFPFRAGATSGFLALTARQSLTS